VGLAAPLFLLGALAIALPLWLHRLQTKTANTRPFSSAMLLETSEQRVHVQKQLKYLLLLALRITLLALLALAFAKPFIERSPEAAAAAAAGSELIVVDASASMQRSGVFGQALNAARRAIDEADADAALQLIVAGARVRELLPASTDKAAQRSALDDVSPSSARVDFGQLMGAVESYAELLPQPVRLYFISDFQASAMPVQFADVVPAGISAFIPHAVGTGEPVNWAISQVRETASGVEVVALSEGLSDRPADIELRLNDEIVGTRTVSGPGRYSVTFDDLELVEGDNRLEFTLDTDDDLAVDNVWYAVLRNDPPRPVPLLTARPDGLPVTYLSAALEAIAEARFGVEPVAISDFDPRTLSRYRWAIIDDLGSVTPPLAEALTAFLEGGGNLMAFTAEAALAQERLPVSGRALAPADLGSGVTPHRDIGSIDDRHPALSGTDGWHRVRVTRSVALELDGSETVPVRLDNGAPFIVEERHGAGRLLLVLSAADNRWNDFPVHPVFVGFMIEAANYLSGGQARFDSYFSGETLSLAASGAGQVVDPQGESLLSLAATADVRSIRLEQAGIYAVYTAEDESLVAVNVDPRESELTPVAESTFARWQEAGSAPGDVTGVQTSAAPEAEPLGLWPWLLLMLALVVGAESALGNARIATRMRAT